MDLGHESALLLADVDDCVQFVNSKSVGNIGG